MDGRPEVSVVVPLLNEEGSLPRLVEEVGAALGDTRDWELILVDDGSTDRTAAVGQRLARDDSRVRMLRLARHYGQTTALQAGFDHARGASVVSMDGDLQNDPRDIPRLLARLEDGYDLVAGYRRDRREGFLTRRLPSRIANHLLRLLTGVPVRDVGCSLRAYGADLVRSLELYSEMHRYLPVVAVATAGARMTELPVRHRPRVHGRSKYGLGRTWRVLLDLLTLTALRRFRERPLHLFTLAAAVPVLAGLAFSAGTVWAATVMGSYQAAALVFPGSALLCFGLAAYLVMLGLLAQAVLPAPGARLPGAAKGGTDD